MLKKLSLSLILLMLVATSTPVIVNAQTEEPVLYEATTTSTEETSEEMTVEQKAQKLKDRIAAAKEKATEKLTAAQTKKIANVCKTAQTKIENTQANSTLLLEKRQAKYTSISDKLKSLSTKLAVAGADTAQLDIAITEMDTKYQENFMVLNEYVAGLEDITSMDCATDATGFKAILDEVRTRHKEILSQTMLIRAYVNENVKPLLQEIRATLVGSTVEEGDTTNE